MFSNFMLPSPGAFTLNGTVILTIGAIAALTVIYKYRNNINFTNTEDILNKENNPIKYTKKDNVTIKDTTSNNPELDITNVQKEEKIEMYE